MRCTRSRFELLDPAPMSLCHAGESRKVSLSLMRCVRLLASFPLSSGNGRRQSSAASVDHLFERGWTSGVKDRLRRKDGESG